MPTAMLPIKAIQAGSRCMYNCNLNTVLTWCQAAHVMSLQAINARTGVMSRNETPAGWRFGSS